MPNYIPKEKKPVLNRETVKKDLKYNCSTPPFFRFVLFCSFAFCLALAIILLIAAFSSTGFEFAYLLIVALVIAAIAVRAGYAFVQSVAIPFATRFEKYYFSTDTIDHKVAREKVKDWENVKEHNGDRYRYPCVLYFKKYGRFELCFDSSNYYDEYDSMLENSIERMLDSYKLEKEYIVVTFGKKKPIIALVYDPDDYDVQL